MDNEMIERVSKVLMKHVPSLSTVGAAIVAMEFIQAMREPTEKMMRAYGHNGNIDDYRNMIDAITND